jgi:hypothetical protein
MNLIIPLHQWTFVSGQYNSKTGNFILYQNTNEFISSAPGHLQIPATVFGIGGNGGYYGPNQLLYPFNGSIANLQIYNTSLTENQIGQIYSQGIGGIPLSNAGLLAWYPLQGNANDYSGHGNVGFPENVTYTNSGYAPASLRNAYSKSVSSMQLSLNINGTNKLYNVSVITWH